MEAQQAANEVGKGNLKLKNRSNIFLPCPFCESHKSISIITF
jgi:hypothetical protein